MSFSKVVYLVRVFPDAAISYYVWQYLPAGRVLGFSKWWLASDDGSGKIEVEPCF